MHTYSPITYVYAHIQKKEKILLFLKHRKVRTDCLAIAVKLLPIGNAPESQHTAPQALRKTQTPKTTSQNYERAMQRLYNEKKHHHDEINTEQDLRNQ